MSDPASETKPDRSDKAWLGRHKVVVAIALVVLVVAAPVAWYLGSPLVLDKRVDEDFPAPVALPAKTGSPAATGMPPAESAAPIQLATGEFRGIDHRSSGSATTYRLADGSLVLRLDHDTQNGPDLYVYLIGASDYSTKGDADDFVDLGRLKGNQGRQTYEIPASADLAKYKTVMIWCKQFSTPFAAAPLT